MDAREQPSGLALELCRAVAIAVLGPAAQVRFAVSQTDDPADGLARAKADIVFLSGGSLSDRRLAEALIPGPVVFIDQVRLMVPAASPAATMADLGGKTICLIIGSPAQRALEAVLGSGTPPIARLSFREDVELLDAYNVGRCDAAVDDASRLEAMRRLPGINRLQSRMLDPPLSLTPLLVATGIEDGAWASLVFGVLNTLIANAAPESKWHARASFHGPGLREGWPAEVTSALGGYTAMRARSMGAANTWPNAPWPEGLLTPPAND